MLIINHSQVRELLHMRDCMAVVGQALSDLARGEARQPLRSGMLRPDRRGLLAWMPGSLAAGQSFGIKVLSVVENPGELGVESHQGGVMIFDPANGSPLALCEAGAITAVRTAAVSALATDKLARPGAIDVAILGAGTQAGSHVEAMLAVRPVEGFRVALLHLRRDAEQDRKRQRRFQAEHREEDRQEAHAEQQRPRTQDHFKHDRDRSDRLANCDRLCPKPRCGASV